jgi:hypothetical protein
MQIKVGGIPRLAFPAQSVRDGSVGDYTNGDGASGKVFTPATAAQRVSETGGEGER